MPKKGTYDPGGESITEDPEEESILRTQRGPYH